MLQAKEEQHIEHNSLHARDPGTDCHRACAKPSVLHGKFAAVPERASSSNGLETLA